mmetsp:Transcript_60170/g.160169  ORF Transcript_60170/g.160169 Transcript_60170/m.160169 type:complete len:222 (-) Transcript_60170:929-1594(-)
MLVQERVQVTHGAHARLETGLVQKRDHGRERGCRGRRASHGEHMAVYDYLVPLSQSSHVRSGPASRGKHGLRRQPCRAVEVPRHRGLLCLEGVEHLREPTTATVLIDSHLLLTRLLVNETRGTNGSDPRTARWPGRVEGAARPWEQAVRVTGARVATGKDDGLAVRGELGEVSIYVGHLPGKAAQLVPDHTLNPVGNRVHQRRVVFKDVAGPLLHVPTKVQ